jgi:hypothetical protein
VQCGSGADQPLALKVARSTIQDNLGRAQAAGMSWPLSADVSDAELEGRLFSRPAVKAGTRRRPEPDYDAIMDVNVTRVFFFDAGDLPDTARRGPR